jgi:MSHA pilin protein MshD
MMTRRATKRSLLRPIRNARGFTLLEAILLLVIAAIALPGLMIYFVEAMEHSADVQMDTMATGLAQELMEEIKTKRWDEAGYIPPGGPYSAITIDGGESRCNPTIPGCLAFDDMDDYVGLNQSPPQDPFGAPLTDFAGFTRTVNVCFVNAVDPPGTPGGNFAADGPCVPGPTNYKLITVTVGWGTRGRITLRSVAANYQTP